MTTFSSILPKLKREDFTHEASYAQTRLPLYEAKSLFTNAYSDPEFYVLEQERVFATSWVAVGYLNQVAEPGQMMVTEVAGQSVVVTRDQTHQLRAYYNVCRHRGSQLVLKEGQSKRFQCPYHGWQYNLKGDCTAMPMFDQGRAGKACQRLTEQDTNLLPVRVETWGFLIFINLDAEAMPLATWLGDLPQRLAGYGLEHWQVGRQQDFSLKSNWKLIAENFMEYYHLPWVHPELAQVSRVEDHYREQGPGMYTGMRTTPVSANTDAGGWQGLPLMAELSELEKMTGRFICLFPNVCFSLLPNHAFAMILNPRSCDFTLESTAIILPPGTAETEGVGAALDELMTFWQMVNQQDVDIVEVVQQGLGNLAYPGGRFSDPFEEPLHRFQNMVIDRMVGIRDRIPAGDPVLEEVPLMASTAAPEPAAPVY
ncbi:MAG: aromatic ring-hydroxylating dioxygenase subunit alpha [Elainellaceae cyanobacterium]